MTRLVFVLSFLFSYSALAAGEIDPQMVRPMCGRISESPPPNWTDPDGCPVNRAA
ncbi:MAG: hypothetical protein ACI9LY_002814 [Arenicella sp.]|jgi:hypothetical protein